ncbi:MAG: putative allantoinase [Pseudonocardiales bacterium]|nr:putative allantoinase [Pseudonocardiales bacterium]
MPGVSANGPDLLITARRVVTPAGIRPAAVFVTAGVITDVRPLHAGRHSEPDTGGLEPARRVEVPDDCVLMPGLVDSHVHVNEPGRTAWEGFATATAAAAAGGITTIVDMPLNSIPPTTTVANLILKQQSAAGQIATDVAFWGGAVPGNIEDLAPMLEAGVVGFKCFLLPSGVEEFPHLTYTQLAGHLERIAALDGLLIAHAEDEGIIDASVNDGGPRYADFLASRPAQAETTAIDALLAAARATGARVHIVHLSSAEALPAIAAAKAGGVRVSVETCPHYLTLSAEHIPDGHTEFKCCPPIRGEANRDALWAALREGVIVLIVSDHSPCTPDLKLFGSGDFGAAWGGIASVQLAFPAVWTEARARGFDLADIARWMGSAPAHLAGLATKGAIEPGRSADFSVVAPDETFVVDPRMLRHRNAFSPYAGLELAGVVRQTWLHGEPIDPEAPRGRLLGRSQA